jgi:hypothetical protein
VMEIFSAVCMGWVWLVGRRKSYRLVVSQAPLRNPSREMDRAR